MGGSHDILIMTGNKLRHQYFALQLLKNFPNASLLVERQPDESWGAHAKNPSTLIRRHFNAFHEQEILSFKKFVVSGETFIRSKTLFEVEDGRINDQDIIDKIKEIEPKILIVLSTSLLKDFFINTFPKKIINIHAGLSPYYRGSGTNVFPFYNGELEYVGMTIHYMDVGIDSGDIILQGRPFFERGDNTHTIGCKNIILGAKLMIETVRFYLQHGPPQGVRQDLKQGRVYYKKDFTDEVVLRIQQNLLEGLVDSYIKVQPKYVNIVSELKHE